MGIAARALHLFGQPLTEVATVEHASEPVYDNTFLQFGALRLVVGRARRVQQFLTQPFFVASMFTGLDGVFMPIEETVSGFERLLAGEFDQLPEDAFRMIANIEQATEKAGKG